MISEFDGEPGDLVVIEKEDGNVEGTLMPTPKKHVVVKLKNGYNIGIDKKNIKSMKVVKKYEKKDVKLDPVVVDPKLPKITIIHTGGTIASRVDYKTGGVIASLTPEELLATIPELTDIANIDCKIATNILSENVRFSHHNIIAKQIKQEVENKADGIIVTHGTDTMHYTAAALAFMLEGLNVPVILVGSQRSSDRGSSDGELNLLSAAYFIINSDFAGVGICMHENQDDKTCLILPGTKTRKMHSSRRDAFRPINTQPIARVDFFGKKIELIEKEYPKREELKGSKINLMIMDENIRVGFLKVHPNMFAEELLAFKDFDGLVIEGTGLGNMPTIENDENTKENIEIVKALEELCNKMPVVMTTQTIYGRVNLNVYSAGRRVRDCGVMGNYSDMTPETTFIKLAWLLSNYKADREELEKLMRENLRGEFVNRTLKNTFLV